MQRNEVIGQQEVWNRLMEMVQENRLPHALMFCGPQGCTDAQEMGTSGPPLHLSYHQDRQYGQRTQTGEPRLHQGMERAAAF